METIDEADVNNSFNNNDKNNNKKEKKKNLEKIKCSIHFDKDLLDEIYCKKCGHLICQICAVKEHSGHDFKEIDNTFYMVMLNQLKEKPLSYLKGYVESDKHVSKAVDYCFEESQKQNNESYKIIDKTIQDLILKLQIAQINFKRTVDTDIDQNIELKALIKSQLANDGEEINSLLKKYDVHSEESSSDDGEEPIHLQLIRDSIECNKLINRKKSNIYESFKCGSLNLSIIQLIIDNINLIWSEKDFKDVRKDNPYKQDLMINKIFNPFLCDYYLCHGEPIPDNQTSVSFDSNLIFQKYTIPKHVNKLSFYNGFKSSFDDNGIVIPNWCTTLTVWNTESPLLVGSVPSSVKDLFIRTGYSHSLVPGVIPKSVEQIVCCDIEKPFSIGSIPEGIRELKLRNGYKHQITNGILPKSLTQLSICDMVYPIPPNSIPNTISNIRFLKGYSHPIPHETIPKNGVDLDFYGISQLIAIKTIPLHIGTLNLHNYNDYFDKIPEKTIDKSIKINHDLIKKI